MAEIKSMKEFQRRFFPSEVGKICPYCGRDITEGYDSHNKMLWDRFVLQLSGGEDRVLV